MKPFIYIATEIMQSLRYFNIKSYNVYVEKERLYIIFPCKLTTLIVLERIIEIKNKYNLLGVLDAAKINGKMEVRLFERIIKD